MLRLKEDRGAVGVIIVFMMIPLLVCAALVIDVGAAYAQKRQVQAAADSTALAIALDCARNNCGSMTSTAKTMTDANVRTGTASSTATKNGNVISVATTSVVPYSFAPVIGINSGTVTARSSASWQTPSAVISVLPIAFSWCAFQAQTGGGLPSGSTVTVIHFPKSDASACNGPSGNPVPGGFAWLNTDSGSCTANSSIAAAQTYSDPGRSVPQGCSNSDFTAQLNQTMLLPVFDTFGGTGSGAWYHIYAYVGFKMTDYFFGGQNKSSNPPCSGSNNCIAGYFTYVVDAAQALTLSSTAPDLGARSVKLTS